MSQSHCTFCPQVIAVQVKILQSVQAGRINKDFDAFRTKAYDGGGEENLTFQVGLKTIVLLI